MAVALAMRTRTPSYGSVPAAAVVTMTGAGRAAPEIEVRTTASTRSVLPAFTALSFSATRPFTMMESPTAGGAAARAQMPFHAPLPSWRTK